ncbi:MAG: DUF4091 domain-containing protein, partial [Planctomycetes bacterium]|nr:DUF4091 domain-containing protein [Planctomycetota bacterium]
VITGKHITLYREHFVYVRRPSPRSDARPGLYPDALIPFVNPIDGSELTRWDARRNPKGAKYDAIPFDVWRGSTEVLWVDVFVPPDAKAGLYRGRVTVTGRGLSPIMISIELTVWDFALPDRPTVQAHFGSFHRVAAAHGVKVGSEQYRVIERRYCEELARHRICPPIPSHLYPAVGKDGRIDPSKTHDELARYIRELHVNSFAIRWPPFRDPLGADREKAKRYLASFYSYLKENGWADGAYIYILDEPNDPEAYDRVRRRAALVHEACPGIPVLCTEQTKPSDPKWGSLDEAVDIWVPLWPLHDEPTAKQRLAAGDRLWSYTALCQGPEPSPWWQIDFPVLNYRIPLWINFRYRMTGLLYWTTVYWGHVRDPWLDQPSFRLAYNGEGMLFYPGTDAGFGGPVTSIRLKNIREGMEDAEYFQLLVDQGNEAFARSEVQKVARSWFDWERDPDKVLAARRRLAERILARQNKAKRR